MVAGNAVILASAVPAARRNWRMGLGTFLIGAVMTGVGHIADGNALQAGRDLARHPVWSIRAEIGLALEVMSGGR